MERLYNFSLGRGKSPRHERGRKGLKKRAPRLGVPVLLSVGRGREGEGGSFSGGPEESLGSGGRGGETPRKKKVPKEGVSERKRGTTRQGGSSNLGRDG